MIQIAIYGRGGQGVVLASRLLAMAAFEDGKHAQAFPMFGVERRGAPVQAFCRIDEKPIMLREQVYEADYAIVFDPSLLPIKARSIFVNSTKFYKEARSFDASSFVSKFPKALNTAMISAFCCFTNLVRKESLLNACSIFPAEIRKQNMQIINEVYKKCKQKK